MWPIDLAPVNIIYDIIRLEAETSFWSNDDPSISVLESAYGIIATVELQLGIPGWEELKYPMRNSGAPLYISDELGTSRLIGINLQSINQANNWQCKYTAISIATVSSWLQSQILACDQEA